MDTTSLRLRFGGSMLREILPKEVADELGNRKSASLDLQIANVEGHLVPGLSGAPIVDSTGRLVAIADGGLERGAIASSWGIPVAYLSDGSSWRDLTKNEHQRYLSSAHLFASDTADEGPREVSCGGVTLTKTKTKSFNQIAATADKGPLLRQ